MMKAEWQITDLIIEVQKIMKLTKKTLRFMIENPVILVRKRVRCKFNFVTRVLTTVPQTPIFAEIFTGNREPSQEKRLMNLSCF